MSKRIISLKFELIIKNSDKKVIDKVSDDLRKAYNYLLAESIKDYEFKKNNDLNNPDFRNMLSGYNMRDFLIENRKGTDYENYYSSIVKNTALRLKNAYINFFSGRSHYPKFKAFNVRWFSIYYDEASKIPKIYKDGSILIKLGKDKYGLDLNFKARIKGYFEKGKIKTARITKKLSTGKYYISFGVEINDRPIKQHHNSKAFISIDPNHKNFFSAIDSDGVSLEVNKLMIANNLDKEIDKLKSKLSSKKKYSRRWYKIDKSIKKVHQKRDEQINNALYEIAHYIAKRYNVVIIGDYTPSKDVAKNKNMKRSMLNQTFIGKFRGILQHVCWKYGKRVIIVNEAYTTQTCCITKVRTKREPKEREWVVNGRKILRDLNSGVNIAVKAGYDVDIANTNLSSIDVKIKTGYNHKLKTVLNNCLAQTINGITIGALSNQFNWFYENV
mgnify:CR=1 FL=1